jgi:hypothetical protein
MLGCLWERHCSLEVGSHCLYSSLELLEFALNRLAPFLDLVKAARENFIIIPFKGALLLFLRQFSIQLFDLGR